MDSISVERVKSRRHTFFLEHAYLFHAVGELPVLRNGIVRNVLPSLPNIIILGNTRAWILSLEIISLAQITEHRIIPHG